MITLNALEDTENSLCKKYELILDEPVNGQWLYDEIEKLIKTTEPSTIPVKRVVSLQQKYDEAIDRCDELEKYVEELANIVTDFSAYPPDVDKAKEYKSKLNRCAAN